MEEEKTNTFSVSGLFSDVFWGIISNLRTVIEIKACETFKGKSRQLTDTVIKGKSLIMCSRLHSTTTLKLNLVRF